jgi:YVTN family beta-propeller protein
MHSGAGSVSVIDLETQTLTDTIALSGLPNSIAVSSNDHLYVAYEGGLSADPALEAYNIGSGTAVYSVSPDDAPSEWGLFVSGRSPDRTMIYIHDQTTSSTVYQWDASNIPPTPIGSEAIASGEPTITPIPGDTRFIISPSGHWETARFPNYDGDVPLYDAFTMIRAGTLNVQWSAVAVAASPAGDRIAVAHHDEVVNPTTTTQERHNPYDLHVFNAATLAEMDQYLLPSFVRRHGIAFAANGDIYLLLGKNVSSSIGVIVP